MGARLKRTAHAVLGATTAGGLVAGLVAVTGPPAAAEPVSLTQTYECVFPLIEERPLQVEISTDLPKTVQVGDSIPAFDVVSVSTVDAEAAKGLATVGGATLEGVASADVTVHLPGGPLDITLDNAIEPTPIPRPPADFQVTARGQAPELQFPEPGTVAIDVNSLLLTMTPKDANGEKTGLDTFESECVLDPADQNRTLATIEVVDGRTELSYDLTGHTFLKAANGNAQLSGSLDTTYDPTAGTHSGDLVLDDTKGTFPLMGFLPATADLFFQQDGKTTGTLGADRTLTSHSEMDVGLRSVSLFGLPIGGGEQCRTTDTVKVDLKSGGFEPLTGGTLTGIYDLPRLDTAGCGFLGGLIDGFVAGSGNTIEMNLTHRE